MFDAFIQQFEALQAQVAGLQATVAQLQAERPEWVREAEAQQLTGLSQATLLRERKKPGTLIVFKTAGGLRYERRSLLAYNEARTIRRQPFAGRA